MINVYFLQHRRNFIPTLEYFVSKIKPENKKRLRFFFLTTYDIPISFNVGVKYAIVNFGGSIHVNNYRNKFMWALNQPSDYFFKLDEDIIFSNHVWDYMIENQHLVSQPDVMTLSPTLNIGVPSVDLFIQGFCPELREKLEEWFREVDIQKTAGDRWGMDLEHLNDFTIRADKWDYDAFHKRLTDMDTNIKGIHPVRFDMKIQSFMMQVVMDNVHKFISLQDFQIATLNCPYFVNDVCLYETRKLQQVYDELGFDPYDEIPMNKFAFDNKLKHLYIQNAFAIHTYFAFVTGGQLFSQDEQDIHDTILNKAKEIGHFDLI